MKDKQAVSVVWFNPWLFSGTHQITSQFLKELGAALGQSNSDVKRIGELVDAYAGLLEVGEAVPYIGPLVKATRVVAQAAGRAASKQGEQSVQDARQKVADALGNAARRIVVFIDDIDRLERDEIRQVFKLVRLVADFPNVTYVLSFDRARVERALRDSDDDDGREYLEKIVQSVFDVPDIAPESLQALLLSELGRRLIVRSDGPFHPDAWANILASVIRPLIRTPRDIVRYVNAVGPAVDLLAGEVALEDILALEAVRLFLPEVIEGLRERIPLVTVGADLATAMRRTRLCEKDKQSVQALLELGEQPHVVEELLRHVFPASRFALDNHTYAEESWLPRWRRERRVACKEVLEFYLERNFRRGAVSARLIANLVQSFTDEPSVELLLEPLDPRELEAAIGRLEDCVQDLAAADPAPGLRAVIRSADRLRLEHEGVFDLGAEVVVTRLVLWVLRSIDDPSTREGVVQAVVDGVRSFYWRIEVLGLLGGGGVYPPVVPRTKVEGWERALRAEIVAADSSRLLEERRLYPVAKWATAEAEEATDSPPFGTRFAEPDFTMAVLKSALTYQVSQSLGAVRKEAKMPWSALAKLVGGPDLLEDRLRKLTSHSSEEDGDERTRLAIELARQFVAGEIDGHDRDSSEYDTD